ncbi:Cytochrome b561/ferric reductase transmembrane [Penicillium expansum]|nr:Cytochrome b561/ferric reductase transmembrane [Penicillium expansum]
MVLKVSCILLLEVLIKSTLSQPLTFVVPGRDDIAYHISETDATYIQITASKDVGWVSLSQGQDSPNSSDVAASNTIFVSLKEKYSKKAGLESFTWAYEKEGTVQYGPMRVLEGHDSSNVATTGHDGLRRVVRSTESTETSTVPAQTPSPEEIAALMARYDRLMKIRTIHGSMMAIGFVVLFPTFASLIHLLPGSKPVIKIHASLQAITAILVIVGFGLGVYLNSQVTIKGKHHQAIGALVVILLVIVQPILGIRQHMLFRKTQQKTKWAYAHRWQGRIMLGLGVVNGGIGLNLSRSGSGDSRGALIGYGVVTGIVYVGYFGILAFKAFNARQNPQGDKSDIPERAVRTGTEEHNLTEIPAHN